MSPSHTFVFVSTSEHINVPCADHTPNISYYDVSCGSADVTPGLTPTHVSHISTKSISSLADANKPISLPEHSTSTSATPSFCSSSHHCEPVISNSQSKSCGTPSTSAISKYPV